MTNEEDRDDDIATRRHEGQTRTVNRQQGKNIIDDTLTDIGTRTSTRTPIGRDFLDDDLPPLTDTPLRPRLRESYRDLDLDLARKPLDLDLELKPLDLDFGRKPLSRSGVSADAPAPQADHTARDPLADLPLRDIGTERTGTERTGTATARTRDIGLEPRPSEAETPAAPRAGSRVEERAPAAPPAAPPPPPSSSSSSSQVPAEQAGTEQPKLGGKLIAALAAAAVVIVGGGLWYWLQSGSTGAAPATKAAATAEEPIRNFFYDQVQQAGITSCSQVFPRLGQMTTAGSTYSPQVSWNKNTPANHGILAVAGLSYNRPDLKTNGAAVVFAAPVPNGCEGTAVRVMTLPMSCSAVAEKQLPPTSSSDNLSGVPLYELANGGKLMLLPAAENVCAVVTVAIGEN